MNQDDIAHYCATQITFGLGRDPRRVENFLNKTENWGFIATWEFYRDVETVCDGLNAIYSKHSPRFASKEAKFDENGAQYTWSRCRDFLAKFVAQEEGCPWRLQKPENSTAFIRQLRTGLAKHFAARA